jgi:hypothetical protein
MSDNSRFRASDTDRDRTVAQLQEHFAAGRLSTEECHERIGKALEAKTLGELADLQVDLPVLRQFPGASHPRARLSSPAVNTGRPAELHTPQQGSWALTALGVIALAYVVTGLLTGVWWIPWAVIVIPMVLMIRRSRCRPSAGSTGV